MKIVLLVLLMLSQIVNAQTAATSPTPTASPAPSPAASPEEKDEAATSLPPDPLAGVIEEYTYNPGGKRDPFVPYDVTEALALEGSRMGMGPVFPLQKYDLDQLKLVGIIWGVSQPKAMLTDPTGRGHVVKINDRIGRNNGYVARIREGEVVVIESFKGLDGRVSYQTKIMKLSSE